MTARSYCRLWRPPYSVVLQALWFAVNRSTSPSPNGICPVDPLQFSDSHQLPSGRRMFTQLKRLSS